jgi:hypothetical protein
MVYNGDGLGLTICANCSRETVTVVGLDVTLDTMQDQQGIQESQGSRF